MIPSMEASRTWHLNFLTSSSSTSSQALMLLLPGNPACSFSKNLNSQLRFAKNKTILDHCVNAALHVKLSKLMLLKLGVNSWLNVEYVSVSCLSIR